MTIETQDTDKETALLNTMKIIWLGLFFYPVVLVFVAFKVLKPAEVQNSELELVFQIMAIVVLIASHLLPKRINKDYQQKLKEKNNFATVKAYFLTLILALALSESAHQLATPARPSAQAPCLDLSHGQWLATPDAALPPSD